jgi:hypothetical protein
MTFLQASEYALRVKERYRQAVGEQAQLQSWLGIGLISLSAAAIGLGAVGGSTDAIIALGLAGGGGYGMGTWLLNRPRQAAYVAGIKAVTCAEDAITPLALPEAGVILLGKNLGVLGEQIPKVEEQAAVVSEIIDRLQPKLAAVPEAARKSADELVKDATVELANAKSLVTSADTAYTTGTELKQVEDALGRRLAIAIDKIVDTVDGIIVETQRDPQALSAIISGLGATYKTFTTVPEALKGVPPGKALGPQAEVRGLLSEQQRTLKEIDTIYTELKDAVKALRVNAIKLSSARRAVAVMVNTVGKDAPLKALESCGVKSGDIVTGLTIDPAGPFEVAKSSTVGFVAKGGMSPYSATVKGPSDGVIVTQPAPFSPAFNVTASKEAQAGTYVVNVFDGSGQIKRVEIVVKDGGQSATGRSGAATTSSIETSPVLAQFIKDVKGKSIEIKGTGVKLKIGEPELQQDKVSVPAAVDSVDKPKLNLSAFSEDAVKKALMDTSASGITVTQFAIKDFPALKQAAEDKAKAQPG